MLLAGHRIEVELAKDLPLVEFDAVLIERVLCNLLENAAKYTPMGSTIRLAAVTSESALRVSVTDNGPGLPKGQEEAIFEKFTRGERESATSGVGLGLAICRAIVQAHKGKIWGENSATGGARFSFTLPLGIPPAMPPSIEEQQEAAAPAR
jgi:two-component system sensor histidine kinase KdpD